MAAKKKKIERQHSRVVAQIRNISILMRLFHIAANADESSFTSLKKKKKGGWLGVKYGKHEANPVLGGGEAGEDEKSRRGGRGSEWLREK